MSFLGNSDEAKTIVNDMQNDTCRRKSVYNPYTKKFQLKNRKRRLLAPNKLPYFPSVTSSWEGDVMNRNPSKGHLRFWVQNCNGVKINDASNTNHNFTQLHEYGVHYFSFTEANVNTSNPHVVSTLHRTFRNRFPSGRMTITNTPGFPKNTSFQPGGIFSGFDATLNSRFISKESDLVSGPRKRY